MNNRKVLYVIRGLPGSGKTTLARALGGEFLEADSFFYEEDGLYNFNPSRLKEAHAWCLDSTEKEMQIGTAVIAVSNTSTQRWEYQPYLDLAAKYGYRTFVLTCENNFGNIHGVPNEAIARMAARWEPHKD